MMKGKSYMNIKQRKQTKPTSYILLHDSSSITDKYSNCINKYTNVCPKHC